MQRKIKRKLVSLMLAASLAGSSLASLPMNVFAGMGSNGVMMAPEAKKVKAIQLANTPTGGKLDVGDEFTFTVIFSPSYAYADYKKVEWSSNNAAVATVDQTGKVKAIAPGEATITATAKNGSENLADWKTQSITITVLQPVTAVTIGNAPANNTMDVGKEFTLTATLSPDNVSDKYKTVAWLSSDTDVATVDQTGKVTALKAGQAKITATAKNGSTDENDWVKQSVDITVLQPVFRCF